MKDNYTELNFETYGAKPLHYFNNTKDLSQQVPVKNGQGIEREAIGKYFLPHNTNFESIDGLVFTALDTLILFQITIAKKHNSKAYGLRKLCAILPVTIKNMNIVFVIPEDRIKQYTKVQNVPEAIDVRPNAMDLTINQFRLVLREEQMQLMAIKGPFKEPDGSEGEDESESGDENGEDSIMCGTQ